MSQVCISPGHLGIDVTCHLSEGHPGSLCCPVCSSAPDFALEGWPQQPRLPWLVLLLFSKIAAPQYPLGSLSPASCVRKVLALWFRRERPWRVAQR